MDNMSIKNSILLSFVKTVFEWAFNKIIHIKLNTKELMYNHKMKSANTLISLFDSQLMSVEL